MDSQQIIKRLGREGWFRTHQTDSHIQFKHASKPWLVTVPRPKKDMPAGTLKSIFAQAELPWK